MVERVEGVRELIAVKKWHYRRTPLTVISVLAGSRGIVVKRVARQPTPPIRRTAP